MAGLREAADSVRIFLKHHRKNVVNAGIVMIVLGAVILLTKEKAPEATSAMPETAHIIVRANCEDSSANPLKMNSYDKVDKVVREYYAGLAKDAKFVGEYTNVDVYTKLGPYENSYIVFAYYEMKIKDIYTLLPGLGTLYVEKKDTDKNLHVVRKVEDESIKQIIKGVAGHEDVQVLMTDAQAKYEAAVQSDVTLQQALAGLQQAYEDASDGTKSSGKDKKD